MTNIQLLIPSLGIFLMVVCAGVGIFFIVRGQINKRIRNRLQDVIVLNDGEEAIKSIILRDMDLSSIGFLNRFLKNAEWARKLDTLLVQADVSLRLGTFIALILFLAALGTLITNYLFHQPLLGLPVAFIFGAAPILYVRRRKQKRVHSFEEQFPDALDMLTGALRSGLAMTGAILVVAEESPDPVAQEFRILFEENRLGLDLKIALRKFGARVDSAELNLFVTAVILQRETGGNLAEILVGTAAVIRDRFRILGDIRTMTAQAKLSGLVLMVLPAVLTVVIYILAPDYFKSLLYDPVGRILVVVAVILQVVGVIAMRRIIDIKV